MSPFDFVSGCIRSDVWPRELLALHVASDAPIGLAYLAIPTSLLILRHKRGDIPVDYMTVCFAAFILFCGGTHIMAIITPWYPVYWLDGYLKAATAGVSIATAILLQFRALPQLLAIPNAETTRKAREETEWAKMEAERAVKELQAANARLETALAQVDQHAAAIRELSTPVLTLAPKVLLSPIVGALDSARADQLTTAILEATSARRAAWVILDLTGVPIVDTQVADVLLRCAKATSLLGAKTVLTGMRPAVARTCVELGIDMVGIVTVATLQDGLRVALAK